MAQRIRKQQPRAHEERERFTRERARRSLERVKVRNSLGEAGVGHLEHVGGQVGCVDDALKLSLDGSLAPKIILFEACKFAHDTTGNLVVDFVQLKHYISQVNVARAIGGMVIHT